VVFIAPKHTNTPKERKMSDPTSASHE